VMTIEDDDTPDDKAQLKVNTNLDCWGRVSGGRTTLITILILEIEFSEPDNHIRFFEISDNERSASEIPASSTLHKIDDSQPHAMMTTTVARCITDSDCNEDEWEVCSLESGECVMKSKSCPNNCSNAGECTFVSRHDWRVRLSGCGVLDVDCESR
jgi:hypothetical protein